MAHVPEEFDIPSGPEHDEYGVPLDASPEDFGFGPPASDFPPEPPPIAPYGGPADAAPQRTGGNRDGQAQ